MVGKSASPTAASFIRPNRPSDRRFTFVEALKRKYGSNLEDHTPIEISGKTVEEVGFAKIRQQLRNLQSLETVDLNDWRIGPKAQARQLQAAEIRSLDLKAQSLDLSNNLLDQWEDILVICRNLSRLQSLRLT